MKKEQMQQAAQARPLRIVVVGQTPPPLYGQALMIKLMVEAKYEDVELFHVRMGFSTDMTDVGRFSVVKLLRLFALLLKIAWTRLKTGADAMFYPPAGPQMVPVLRDLVILSSTRWMFRQVIFRFHAGGVTTFRDKLSAPLRPLFDYVYREPDLSIAANEQTAADPIALRSKRIAIVPHGISDTAGGYIDRRDRPVRNLLFVGALIEGKGALVLLEALVRLRERGHRLNGVFVGEWMSPKFKKRIDAFVDANGLSDQVEFTGMLFGDDKWARFREADLFSMPSFYENETSGAVLIEAMAFSLPVVTTYWRGIPSVVSENETALLVPIQDVDATAEALEKLLLSSELRERLGIAGRKRFEEHFSVPEHIAGLNRAFLSLREPQDRRLDDASFSS